MVKLQAYIFQSQNGYRNLANINPSGDVRRYICDYRPVLELLDYDAARSQTFLLVSYVEEGSLITVLRTTPPEKADHLAVTVFIPRGTKLPAEICRNMLRDVGNCIRGGALSENGLVGLRTIFAADYAIERVSASMVPSSGSKYAVAYYNSPDSPSLDDYCAARFYQPEYADYVGVVLIDARSGVRSSLPNITEPRLRRLATLRPPGRTKQGFDPYIYRLRFATPFLVPDGEDVDLLWRRSGFESINQKIHIEGDDTAVPVPDTSTARKIINPSSFFVTAQGSREPVVKYKLKVNGHDVDGPVPFRYSELVSAKVEITAPGFEPFSGDFDLASNSRAIIQMRPLHRTYRFDLPLNSPEPAEAVHIFVKSKKPVTKSPIEGYEVTGDVILEGSGAANSLAYVGSHNRHGLMLLICALAAGIVIGLLAGYFIFSPGRPDSSPDTEATEATALPSESTDIEEAAASSLPAVETPATATADDISRLDYAKVAQYLDTHKAWRKPDLQALYAAELFDDLNNYNFEALLNRWAPNLGASRNFAEVVKAVRNSATKRDPRTGHHAPTYNPEGDEAITWLAYTYWIDP